jgi:TPR repeat protein
MLVAITFNLIAMFTVAANPTTFPSTAAATRPTNAALPLPVIERIKEIEQVYVLSFHVKQLQGELKGAGNKTVSIGKELREAKAKFEAAQESVADDKHQLLTAFPLGLKICPSCDGSGCLYTSTGVERPAVSDDGRKLRSVLLRSRACRVCETTGDRLIDPILRTSTPGPGRQHSEAFSWQTILLGYVASDAYSNSSAAETDKFSGEVVACSDCKGSGKVETELWVPGQAIYGNSRQTPDGKWQHLQKKVITCDSCGGLGKIGLVHSSTTEMEPAVAAPVPPPSPQPSPQVADGLPHISSIVATPIPNSSRGRSFLNWKFTITGSGFGQKQPFTGTSDAIKMRDLAGTGWNAASPGCTVGIKVSSWTDSRITIEGFVGAYDGGDYVARPGDQIQFRIYKPDSRTEFGTSSVLLSRDSNRRDHGNTMPQAEAHQSEKPENLAGAERESRTAAQSLGLSAASQPATLAGVPPTEQLVSSSLKCAVKQPRETPPVYEIRFSNTSGMAISDIFIVVLEKPLPENASELGAATVWRMGIPGSGQVGVFALPENQENKAKTPLAYAAIFSPKLGDPLWIRVAPDGPTPEDPALGLLRMAEQIKATGASDDAVNERYRRILRAYPESPVAKTARERLGWTDKQLADFVKSNEPSRLSQKSIDVGLAKSAQQIVVSREEKQLAAAAEAARIATEKHLAEERAANEKRLAEERAAEDRRLSAEKLRIELADLRRRSDSGDVDASAEYGWKLMHADEHVYLPAIDHQNYPFVDDDSAALELIEQAGSRGSAKACEMLGFIYDPEVRRTEGSHSEEDLETLKAKAEEWLTKGSTLGDSDCSARCRGHLKSIDSYWKLHLVERRFPQFADRLITRMNAGRLAGTITYTMHGSASAHSNGNGTLTGLLEYDNTTLLPEGVIKSRSHVEFIFDGTGKWTIGSVAIGNTRVNGEAMTTLAAVVESEKKILDGYLKLMSLDRENP